jgi:hypothetical protein
MLPADPRPGNGRALGAFAIACAVAVPLWWFGMFVASMTPEAPRRLAIDLDGYFLPRYVVGNAHLAAGSLALWNADEFAGVPLLGTGQAAVLYPPRVVLFGLLPPLAALHAFMVLHYVVLAVGSFVFLRVLGLTGAGAALGAIVVTFQPFMLNGHYAPHWISNFAWTPLVLAGGVRAMERPSLVAGSALAAAASMQVLAGYPEYALDTGLVLAAFVGLTAHDVARERGWRAVRTGLLTLAGAAGCAILVTAVQWVPLLETARQSVRATGDYEFMFGLRFERERFAAGLLGWVDALGLLFYLPPLGWLLLAIGVIVPGLRHRLAIAALAVVCFAIPTWWHTVPPFSLFRGPLCWHSILHLSLGALAGAGLGAVLNGVGAETAGPRVSRWAALALAAGALALSPLLAPRALAWLAVGMVGVGVTRALRRPVGIALVLASALGAVWTWVPAPKIPGAKWKPPHRYAVGQPTYPRIDERLADGAALRAACGRFAAGRVLAPHETWLGVPLLAGLATPQGYPESLAPRYTSALLDGAGLAPLSVFQLDRARLARARGVLRLLDVECVVLPADWAPVVTALGFERAGPLTGRRVAFVRRGAAAFLPAAVVPVANDDEALAAVLAPTFDPDDRAIMIGSGAPPVAGGGGIVRVERPAPGRVTVETTVPAGGYLVVSETWYPGWRARVDGAPARVERADYAFIGVPLPPGARRVDLWYEPRGFAAARWATVAGLILLVVGGVSSIRMRARA